MGNTALACQVLLVVKNQLANARDARDLGLISGSGRPPGGGNSNALQYSCLENSMDRGAWLAAVHGGCRESDMFEATKYAYLQHSFGACPMVLMQVTSF